MSTELNNFIREMCNGNWSISSMVLLVVLTVYLFCTMRYSVNPWRKPAVQAAAVLIALIGGHTIRSFFSWMEFFFSAVRGSAGIWGSAVPFMLASVIVFAGKILCIWMFMPPYWHVARLGEKHNLCIYRWQMMLACFVLAVAIPPALHYFFIGAKLSNF